MHNKFPKYYYFIDKLDKNYIKKFDENIAIIYRNYKKKINIKKIQIFRNLLKKKQIKFFLANNVRLSIQLNLDGAYIPSFNQRMNSNCFTKKNNFILIGSAHNIKEIKIKEKQGVKLVFIAPLFKTLKSKNCLDINKFKNLSKKTSLNLIALGGINRFNFKKLFLLNIYGFASISFFKNIDKVNLTKLITKHKYHIYQH